ncbi:MAG TPA: UbiD family decarboxylase, partial [Dehalococcoidia bacterium]|nr:UbiD family decarboxylase [Dehalococcoidia bacterium]
MKDLREWLAAAEAIGELAVLRGIPWDLDIGVITEMASRRNDKPALLFDDIPGYPSGYRVLSNVVGSRGRLALTMGFPTDLSLREMLAEWRRRSRELKLLPPRFVDSGPLMENALFGEEVDLLRLPVPKWHERDGGRYMGTADAVITRGPEGDTRAGGWPRPQAQQAAMPESTWTNLGAYRLMVNDRNHLALSMGLHHHGHLHMDAWHR